MVEMLDDIMDDSTPSYTPPPAEIIMELEHVGLNYGNRGPFGRGKDFWALKDVSFTLYKGDSLGIIGRNGVGKSTLLKIMAGILKPDAGEVHVRKTTTAALLSLQVGFVPHLSGRENIYLSGLMLGMRYQQLDALLPKIVEFAELQDAIDKPIHTYSDGMRARLGFAVSIQMNPDILLVDEVLGVGDAAFREKSSTVLKDRIYSDRTVVLVSHNPETISNLCNRAVWIEQGVTRLQGDTDLVLQEYERYLNLKG